MLGFFGKVISFFLRPIIRIPLFVLSVTLYALTVLAAYGGRFNPDFFTLPATLTLLLPGLAIATLCVTAGWFLIRGYAGGCLGVLAIIASWGPVSTAIPFGSKKKATPGMQTFTLMTWNLIHGWDQEGKSDSVNGNRAAQYIIDADPDIVCIQELDYSFNALSGGVEMPYLTKAQHDTINARWPYRDGLYDMRVISKYPMVFEKGYNYVEGDFDPKRYSFFKINVNGHRLTVINVHLLSFRLNAEERDVVKDLGKGVGGAKSSLAMLRTDIRDKLKAGFQKRKKDVGILRRTIDRMKGPLIICGDFNDVPESYAYRLMRGDDLKDAFVETGFGPLVTYNRHAFWVHLDQVLYRGPLKALSVRKGTTKASDHYPLLTEFEFTDQ